jgi:hypothetical protein
MVNANDIRQDDAVEIWVQDTPTGGYVDGAFMLAVLC